MPVFNRREQAARNAWTRLVTPFNAPIAQAKYDILRAGLEWQKAKDQLRSLQVERREAVAKAKAERDRIFSTIPPSAQELSHRAKAEAAQDEYARSHSPNW